MMHNNHDTEIVTVTDGDKQGCEASTLKSPRILYYCLYVLSLTKL